MDDSTPKPSEGDIPVNNTDKVNNGRGKRGAPLGNVNAQRHGLRSGTLPLKCRYIQNVVNKFRRELERVVFDLKGEINLLDASNINSATKWETHGQLARYWLRTEIESLSPSDRLRFSEAIARASDNRDRAIRLLGLDVPPEPLDLKAYLEVQGKQK